MTYSWIHNGLLADPVMPIKLEDGNWYEVVKDSSGEVQEYVELDNLTEIAWLEAHQ